MLDGKPVRRFTVALVPPASTVAEVFSQVDDPMGTFAVDLLRRHHSVSQGLWKLIIVGDDFSMHSQSVGIGFGYVCTPVVVSLSRGYPVAGKVIDQHGTPVAGAVVRLVQRLEAFTDPRLARDTQLVTSSDGTYRFQNVSAESRAHLSARVPSTHSISDGILVTADSGAVDLTVVPGGALHGFVRGTGTASVAVVASSAQRPMMVASVGQNGSFSFDDVPVGEYAVGIMFLSEDRGLRFTRQVVVTEGQVAAVILDTDQ